MPETASLQMIKQKLQKQRDVQIQRLKKKRVIDDYKESMNLDNADRAIISRKEHSDKILISKAEKKLHDIDEALDRLEQGTYGICTECGNKIQLGRLDVVPTATLCIECQRIQEKKVI
jgi:DnaK suppressor protein